MKEYVFDEIGMLSKMVDEGMVDDVNINRTIKKLARYAYINNMNNDESYDFIVNYMNKNCKDFSEVGSFDDINGCIKDAPKAALKNITQVVITKTELDIIVSLNDIREEKLAFVLLADAKYDNACKNKKLNLSFLTNSDLFRFARVTMPIKERDLFLHFLYENQLVEVNINPMATGKRLLYVSENDSDVGIVLTENNYKELAFTYLNWKNGGYKECKNCGRLFRAKKNAQYCKKCAPKYEKIEYKTIKCTDCGVEVWISSKDNKAYRCEDCQRKSDYIQTGDQVKVCVNCKTEFIASSKSKTDLCKKCYEIYRRQRKTDVMNMLRKK